MYRLLLIIAIPSLLASCHQATIISSCEEPDPLPDAGPLDPSSCVPDTFEPDDDTGFWFHVGPERPRQTLRGTWHDDAPDVIRTTVQDDLATLEGQIFRVEVDGASELTLNLRCVTGSFEPCDAHRVNPQECETSASFAPGEPATIELRGRCSFGAAVLDIEALPAPNAACEREIRVEVGQ